MYIYIIYIYIYGMLYVTYLSDHMIYQVPMYVGERERGGWKIAVRAQIILKWLLACKATLETCPLFECGVWCLGT